MSSEATSKKPSIFPVLPPFNPDEKYTTIVKNTKQEFEKYEQYAKKIAEIEITMKAWTACYSLLATTTEKPDKEPLKKEFADKVDQYREYRDLRDELKRILSVYASTIAKCQPPILDLYTLQEMRKMGFDAEKAKLKFDYLFSVNLGELNEQSEKIQKLYDKIIVDLPKLKLSLEPLGEFVGTESWKVLKIANSLIKRPAYVKTAVDARDIEVAQLKAEQPKEPVEQKKA